MTRLIENKKNFGLENYMFSGEKKTMRVLAKIF